MVVPGSQDAGYGLFAVVVHVGSGPNHGHYVCLVKSHGQWLTYDDDTVAGAGSAHSLAHSTPQSFKPPAACFQPAPPMYDTCRTRAEHVQNMCSTCV